MNLFKSVKITENILNDEEVDLDINIEEKQTGTVNAGVSIGSLDGFAIVAGLSERNFYGTGRSLNALINTSDKKNEFTLNTSDRLFYENNVDISYKANYKELDYSSSSSYNLNSLSTGVSLSYDYNSKIRHSIGLDYILKDYEITNRSTVSSSIAATEGGNASFLLTNNLYFSTLNSIYRPKDGQMINFTNFLETPSSSSNGYIKNILTIKNYKSIGKNIISNQR